MIPGRNLYKTEQENDINLYTIYTYIYILINYINLYTILTYNNIYCIIIYTILTYILSLISVVLMICLADIGI